MKNSILFFALILIAKTLNVMAQNPPVSFTIVEYDYHSAKLSATANASGDNILIAITDEPKVNDWGQILPGGTFGTPSGNYQIGDPITGGGVVVYIGSAFNNIIINELNDNTIYHLQVWSRNSAGNYSATFLSDDFLTWGIVPYVSHFALEELAVPPFGWSVAGGSIYIQPCLWEGFWLQQETLNGSTSNPAVMSLTTQWLQLDNVRNTVSFRYYMAVPGAYGGFYEALSNTGEEFTIPWEAGSYFDIQVSIDDINYVTVYTINSANSYPLAYPRNNENMATLTTPPFDTFKGQRVKVRLHWYFVQKVQTHVEDIYIDPVEVGECDGVYGISSNPMTGGKAEISWNSFDEEADLWEIRYRTLGGIPSEWSEPVETTIQNYLLTELPFLTQVEVQVRVKCSTSSFSEWGSHTFITGSEFDPCEYPVNLNVINIMKTSATLLWEEGNEENLSWDLRYRKASETLWNNVEALVEKSYFLQELTPNTAYLWTVRANCSNDRTSSWATQSDFTTNEVGVSSMSKEMIKVFASGKIINIINPENIYIKDVQLYSIEGRLLNHYTICSTENVLITTDLPEMIGVVKITGEKEAISYKVAVRP